MWLAIWAAGRVQEHLDWWKEENFFQKIIFFLGAECQALCRAVNGAVYFSHYNKVRPVPAQDILKHAPPFQGDDFRNDYEGHCGCFSTCPWPGSFSCRNSCDDDVRNSHKCHCMRSVNVMMTSWHHNLSFQRIAATRCDQLHIMRDRKMLRNFHFCKSIKVLSMNLTMIRSLLDLDPIDVLMTDGFSPRACSQFLLSVSLYIRSQSQSHNTMDNGGYNPIQRHHDTHYAKASLLSSYLYPPSSQKLGLPARL